MQLSTHIKLMINNKFLLQCGLSKGMTCVNFDMALKLSNNIIYKNYAM